MKVRAMMSAYPTQSVKSRFKYSLILSVLLMTSACQHLSWLGYKEKPTPDARVKKLETAVSQNPDDIALKNKLYLEKERALDTLMEMAETAYAKGDLETAQSLYDKIIGIDPYHRKALAFKAKINKAAILDKKIQAAKSLNETNQVSELKEAKKLVRDVLLEQPEHTQADNLNQQLDEKNTRERASLPQLKSQLQKPVSLELREANIKIVFEALSRATGISFILDKDIKPDTKASVFVKKMSIEDAIEVVLASNGLQKKMITETSMLVFPATLQKTKDYQDLLIRNFYFTNTTAKLAADMLKMILKVKDIYVDERLNMLVLRDRPEVIALAEKMIKAQDIADPEVMLEIEVLEISRNKLQELGIGYPTTLTVLNNPLTLETIQAIKSSTVGVNPAPNLRFRATDSDLNLLSNPRIRVKNNEKAKVMVGNKVPVITTNAIQGGVTSESVSYVDVGLKLDVEPKIMLDDFINIKVGLEVSSLGEAVTLTNGSKVFNIGTRNASTSLRLKHGETQVLAGLIQDSERNNADKLPGLGDIPLLGRLFSRNVDEKNKTEIVLAITPRVISNIALPSAVYSEYWSGTESQISDKPLINPGVEAKPLSRAEQVMQQQQQRQKELNDALIQAPTVAQPSNTPPVVPPENNNQTPNVAPEQAQMSNKDTLPEADKQNAEPALAEGSSSPETQSDVPPVQ